MNNKKFSMIHNFMRTYLTYSQLTGQKAPKEEIIRDIQSLNLDEALLILAKMTVINDESKKRVFMEMKPLLADSDAVDYTDLFDLSNILYTIKWFLAYGRRNPFLPQNNHYPKYAEILLVVLKISDYMSDITDGKFDTQGSVIKSYLLLRSGEIDKAIIRQYVMFELLAPNKELFKVNEYIDIQDLFQNATGYTISQYVATLFALNRPSLSDLRWEHLTKNIEWAIPKDEFFNKVGIKDVSNLILEDISEDPIKHRAWALNTIDNPYDFEMLLSKPFFKYNNKLYPFSPAHINATLFDGLCFKLNSICSNFGKSFFNFFGRLFENYNSLILEAAVKDAKISSYEFIPEFKYGLENKDSSDAYIRLGTTLIIFESKGGRIRKETKIHADPNTSLKDFNKYVVNPILQANKAYIDILKKEPSKFTGVKKVVILSVSLQSFPRVPMYNELLYQDEFKSQLHPHVKAVDYIGLSELELFALIINKLDTPLQKFILSKKQYAEYVPYLSYYYNKHGLIKRTDYLSKILKDATESIKNDLKFNK